jgi:hypothetical protein
VNLAVNMQFEIEECNALGRAVPKLVSKMYRTKAESPRWDEAYHVARIAGKRLRELRQQIAEESAPWFDESAYTATKSTPDRQANKNTSTKEQ